MEHQFRPNAESRNFDFGRASHGLVVLPVCGLNYRFILAWQDPVSVPTEMVNGPLPDQAASAFKGTAGTVLTFSFFVYELTLGFQVTLFLLASFTLMLALVAEPGTR